MKLRNKNKEGKPEEEDHLPSQPKSYHQIAFNSLGLEIMKRKTP